MSKITLTPVGSLTTNPTSAQTEINNNFTTIQTAMDNALSRDGTSPNTMGASLDMNSNQIINLPSPVSTNSPIRVADVNTLNGGGTLVIPTIVAGSNVTLTGVNPTTISVPTTGFGATTITSTSANSLAVGPSGTTNPVIQIDSSVGSSQTGVKINGGPSGGGSSIAVLSPSVNDVLHINAKGSGALNLNDVGTGNVSLCAGGGTVSTGNLGVTGITTLNPGGSSNGLVVTGPNTSGPGLNIINTGAGGHSWSVLSSGGAATAVGSLLFFDNTAGKAVMTLDTAQNLNTPNGGVIAAGGIVSQNPVSGMGYTTGAGGTVTQATSKSTAVTLNKITGQITMNAASLASATAVSFTLSNSVITNTDTVIVNLVAGSYANPLTYQVWAESMNSGSCVISLLNRSGGALAEAVKINFTVIRGATS